jgi:hypothetical protein
MKALALLLGVVLVALNLWDAFETILLPRRVARRWRLTTVVQQTTWWIWSRMIRQVHERRTREYVLSVYAMLTMLMLFMVWALGLTVGYALLQWGAGSRLDYTRGQAGFMTDLYMSGSTFLTLGLGDVTPVSGLARLLTVLEAGTGFGFLALVLAYLPVLYQAFSRREAHATMLDEWAGSPPSAAEMLRRQAESGDPQALIGFLRGWELWSSELMESHLSYPILAHFRSQHDNQSWLSALTAVLDACALSIVGVEGVHPFQARLTFAMARHTVVDLTQVLHRRPRPFAVDRLGPEDLARLRAALAAGGVPLREGAEADRKLADLRGMYEPYVAALADYLLITIPPWTRETRRRDNWQTTAWERQDDEGH